MRYMTEEEKEKRNIKLRRIQKRERITESILGGLRTIIYTPLSIAFHAVSFVAKGVGFISAFGLIIGAYQMYQAIRMIATGTPIGEVENMTSAVTLLILPFIAYGISVVTEKIYRYFENNAF